MLLDGPAEDNCRQPTIGSESMKKKKPSSSLAELTRERNVAPVTLTDPGEPSALAAEQRHVQLLETQMLQMQATAEAISRLADETMELYLQAKNILEKRDQ